jgi:protein-disulfide isomerase
MSMHEQDKGVAGLTGSPKTMFFLGLASGIGGMSVLALVVVLTFLMNGKLPSAWAVNGNTNGNVAVNNPTPTDPNAANPTPTASPVKPVDEKNDHIRGNAKAKVTLIEYSDFQCPYCLRHEDTLKQILANYKNDVRLIYRNYPLNSLHPEAQKAAEAAECASAQGKFWEMHDKIFEANAAGTMSVQKWKDAAKEIGIDTNKFNKCLDGGEMTAKVNQDESEGTTAGVSGTPATFVNGQMVEGAVPYASMEQIIKQAGAAS